MINKQNWKWRIAQIFLILCFNVSSFVFISYQFIGKGEQIVDFFGKKEIISYSLWDFTKFSHKATILLFMLVGLILSVVFIMFLFKRHEMWKLEMYKQSEENKRTEIKANAIAFAGQNNQKIEKKHKELSEIEYLSMK